MAMHHPLAKPKRLIRLNFKANVAQVRFCVFNPIKPYIPPILYPSVNSFNFRTCVYTNQVADSDFSYSLKEIVISQRGVRSV